MIVIKTQMGTMSFEAEFPRAMVETLGAVGQLAGAQASNYSLAGKPEHARSARHIQGLLDLLGGLVVVGVADPVIPAE